jgi:SHS2 domain-containing protein
VIAGEKMKQTQPPPAYVVRDHTADLSLQVWGDSLEDLFCHAAAGMFAQMADLGQTSAGVRRAIALEGDDNEALLVAWLSELLYLREIHREAYVRFEVRFPAPGRLEGVAEGVPWRRFDRPVKAVTYHGLKIRRRRGRYDATIVFDV